MAGDSVITDEMKAKIGLESGTSVYEIDRSAIRRWAEAIGDPNPLYRDEEYARSKGYRDIIAPPGFIAQYGFPVKHIADGNGGGHFQSPSEKSLNGGNEYEFFKPIQAGDTIMSKISLAELRERDGRMGKMLIAISEQTFRNQDGEIVAKSRSTGISY